MVQHATEAKAILHSLFGLENGDREKDFRVASPLEAA